MSSGLSPKQERFAELIAQGMSQSDAYRQTVRVRKNTKPESVWCEASKLMANPMVQQRVEELREAAREAARDQHIITVEKLTQMTMAAYDMAMKEGNAQSAAAIKAAEFLGKLHGLVVERKHVESDNRHHHEVDSVSAFDEFLAEAGRGAPASDSEESLPN